MSRLTAVSIVSLAKVKKELLGSPNCGFHAIARVTATLSFAVYPTVGRSGRKKIYIYLGHNELEGYNFKK